MKSSSLQVSKLLEKALYITQSNALSLIFAVAIVYIPSYILMESVISIFRITDSYIVMGWNILVEILANSLSVSIVFTLLQDILANRKHSTGYVLSCSIRMWPYVLFAYVLTLIGNSVAFSLLLIPGVILSTYLVLSLQVAGFEKKVGVEALQRSIDLIRGRWVQFFSYSVILFIMRAGIEIPYNTIIQFIAVDSLVLRVIGGAIKTIVLIPFSVAYVLLYFYAVQTHQQNRSQSLQKRPIR